MYSDRPYRTLRIKEIREELKDFKTFSFEETEGISYKAGQYLTLVHSAGKSEIRRSYSIASTPGLNEILSIGIKRIPNGFYSRLLIDHAEIGDELVTSGVGGLFVLPEDISNYKQLFFLAAGSGITPIYSILKSALNFQPHLKIILAYSNHSRNSTVFLKEIEQLTEEFKQRLSVEWFFGNSLNLSNAHLHRDSLIQIVSKHSTQHFADILFYVCGPLSYMRMCTFVLQEMEVAADNIKRENFLIAQPKPINRLPPDSRLHYAHIRFREKKYAIPVHYPDSILAAAKKEGIALPYSCETGRCGNCLAQCTKGNVWLSYNEVLTEKELSKGLTLTCVGHPVGGNVELEIE